MPETTTPVTETTTPVDETALTGGRRLPRWLKAQAPGSEGYLRLKRLVKAQRLNTVCESAHCPNIGECWGHGTATFMILGDVCTRSCGFCAIATGRPGIVDEAEPERVAVAIAQLGLQHAVITSVNRDELADGGARIFAATIQHTRQRCPQTSIEVLIPDFQGDWDALATVLDAGPDILNHNIETVPRMYPQMRPQAKHERSLELLDRARQLSPAPTKSGMMLGAGERRDETEDTLRQLADVGCAILTLGQYLSPSSEHVPVDRFLSPEEFRELGDFARDLGFRHVESGPMVRSSYHAEQQVGLLDIDNTEVNGNQA
ncbi:MAG: lipoyl synthase [Gemmatimonadetes bacterium]|jgi:lipoyl synthase|nr:lipoyl synthase [Gemmatimonadota bacterium]MBT7862658.1 lipoyl synthase [Gemmatimonadota bacterium]